MEMNKSTETLETRTENVMVKSNSRKWYLFFSIFLFVAGIGSLTATAAILRTRNTDCPSNEKTTSPCSQTSDVQVKNLFAKVKGKYYELCQANVGVNMDKVPFNFTPDTYRGRSEAAQLLLKEVNALETNVLEGRVKATHEARHALDLFNHLLKNTFGLPYENIYEAGDWLMAPNIFCWQQSCMVMSELSNSLGKFAPKNGKDVERVIELIAKYGELFVQREKNLRYGVKVGIVPPKEACQAGVDYFKLLHNGVIKNGGQGILETMTSIPLLLKNVDSKEEEQWLRVKGSTMLQSIQASLVRNIGRGAYDLIRYLETDYIRHCPPSSISSGWARLPLPYVYTDGVADRSRPTNGSLPGGEEYSGKTAYKRLLAFFTTYDITPKEIDDLATQRLQEIFPKVIEIAKQMTNETNETKAVGKFRAMVARDQYFYIIVNETKHAKPHLKCHDDASAKKNCPARWKAMNVWLNSARSIVTRLRPKITSAFYLTGKKRITPICPLKMAFDYNPTSAYYSYSEGNKDCSHLAVVRIPFFLDRLGPKYEEVTVLAHESTPGHHLEVQGVRENFGFKCEKMGDWVSRHNYFAAYSEGWATYIEKHVTDKDMGLYKNDVMSKYGMLKHQILAAVRAKADVGLHFMGMKRREAIALYEKYALDSGDVIKKEITRLQSAPGQGTSYLVGEAKLSELRKKVEEALEDKLDIRDFHYEILGSGPLPLELLSAKIENYITEQLKGKK